MGARKWYMIFSLTDETYSLLCSLKTPSDVDPDAMRFLVAILDHAYWIMARSSARSSAVYCRSTRRVSTLR